MSFILSALPARFRALPVPGEAVIRRVLYIISALLVLCLTIRMPARADETEAGLPHPHQEAEAETEADLSYPQLTAEDIVRLDGGDAELLYDYEGRVTFIRGRYSPGKVLNHEDAVESLNYVATLLGLTRGALFFCVYGGIDYTTGYTYYLFLQRDGDVTIVNASIKVYVDPEGYTAALSCSFNPATGIREESAGRISAGEAEDIVRGRYPDYELKIYSDSTGQAGIMEEERNIHVWSVFSNNPDMMSGDSDLPYLQHFVSYSGEYLMNLPCSTTYDPLMQQDDALERKAKAMFEGYEKAVWKGMVTLHDGSRMELEVPVAKSRSDGRYYLMDLDRRMLVADYPEAVYGSGEFIIASSDTNSGWKDRELLAMYNIGRVYDYYADHGMYSVDGSGIPLAILSGVCEADGTPVDNAFFTGFWDGFGVFAISDINNSVECLDIMAHEFTHGITSYTMGGSSYVNDLGAINEAYSDIMGNLCELTYSINDLSIKAGKTGGQFEITGTSPYGSTDDDNPMYPDWRIGEMGGKIYRDMSDPVRYRQPAFVSDAYYCLPTGHSNASGNDYGGVHENSSLLGSIAWVLNERGLNFEQQYSLWMTAMNMMTPKSDYDDILQAMIFARKTYGWDEELDTWLEEAFAERGLLENSHSYSGAWDGMSFERYNAKRLEENREKAAATGSTADSLNGEDHGKDTVPEAETDSNTEDIVSGFLTGGGNHTKYTAPEAETDSNTEDILSGFLTGGGDHTEDTAPEAETDSNTEDVLSGFLTGGGNHTEDTAPETEAEYSEDKTDSGSDTEEPDDSGEEDADRLAAKNTDWLDGVSLDDDGRIEREGYGRIDFDTSPEDREILVGSVVLEPYTYKTIAVNCPDEEGHVSFLLPEGTYWVSLCVGRSGPGQTEFWPYTKADAYEQMGTFTRFGEVEVKAGQSTDLPLADVG